MTPKQRIVKIAIIKELLTEKGFKQSKSYPNLFYNDNKTKRFKFTSIKLRKEIKNSWGDWQRLWSEYIIKIDLNNIPIY